MQHACVNDEQSTRSGLKQGCYMHVNVYKLFVDQPAWIMCKKLVVYLRH